MHLNYLLHLLTLYTIQDIVYTLLTSVTFFCTFTHMGLLSKSYGIVLPLKK